MIILACLPPVADVRMIQAVDYVVHDCVFLDVFDYPLRFSRARASLGLG
ncbi:hypothetical protein KAF44_40245 [Cupriavidus necator]|nr:hypothetical protein KAF44_40245 [Cupriavidus necator]